MLSGVIDSYNKRREIQQQKRWSQIANDIPIIEKSIVTILVCVSLMCHQL